MSSDVRAGLKFQLYSALALLVAIGYLAVKVVLQSTAADFRAASDQIVTNCDVGPACGMGLLVGVIGVVLAVAVGIGLVQRWRSDD